MCIVALVAAYAMYQYSQGKSLFKNSFAGNGSRNFITPTDVGDHPADTTGGVSAAPPMGQVAMPESISGIAGTPGAPHSASTKNIDPAELLPRDANSEWSNAPGGGDVANLNMLSAGSLAGINTVGSSLRNPNLQIRSEPQNPRVNTGPWGGSTIEADTQRRPLELGSTV